nr:RagB/SusD family nutrient uptake outer membrane protein [uncultured Sphingobacterium sp.]
MNIKLYIKGMLYSVLLFTLSSFTSCKDSFLDVKPSTDIVSPKTLDDYQQMLDFFRINYSSALPLLASDEYVIANENDWLSLSLIERNSYIWASDLFEGQNNVEDWNYPYESVFYANSVITGMKDLKRTEENKNKYDYILGQAYFIRAFAFFDLAKNFAAPYDVENASTTPGIPLKLSPNVDEIAERATVEETYLQIFADLQMATNLLSSEITANRNRANRPAAYALGARISLSMRQYPLAEKYADSCLDLYDKLIDYNTISVTAATPFLRDNVENLINANIGKNYQSILYTSPKNITVSSLLLGLYASGDLRKEIYFTYSPVNGLTKMKKGYSGATLLPYSGLSTDEVYLIKSECAARRNDLVIASQYLNRLLVNRFRTGSYVNRMFFSYEEAIDVILNERRKELVWRSGFRWDDIRRLNLEGKEIQLERSFGDKKYKLLPGSKKFVFPIPSNELNNSKIIQNIR